MDTGRWKAMESLYHAALAVEPERRSAFLDSACPADPELRHEVESLIGFAEDTGPVGEPPADNVPVALEPGAILMGRFLIVRRIGAGGMGEVYEATDFELRDQVALKVIRPVVIDSRGMLARFRREVQSAKKIAHPNICRVHDLHRHRAEGECGREIIFLTMELLHGETLRARLEREPMPLDEARSVAEQLTLALGAAHQAGVIHCDFKSENVMLTGMPDGSTRAVVTDFGLARSASIVGGSTTITGTGQLFGTPAYMAPEQFLGGPSAPAVDIYALGVVLCEMVAGVRPDAGESAEDLATLGLSPEWTNAIYGCLRREPTHRFADAPAVWKAISGSAPVHPASANRRKATISAAGGFLLLAALIMELQLPPGSSRSPGFDAIHNWLYASPIPAEKRIVVLRFTKIGGDPSMQAVSDGLTEVISNSLTRLEQFHGALIVTPASDAAGVASARQAGRLLNANLAITGSVERGKGTEVRILMNLVDTRTVTQLRSGVLRGELPNLSAIQDDAVDEVARLLDLELQRVVAQTAQTARTTNAQAYPSYVQGLGYLRRYDQGGNIDKAIGSFGRAVSADPHYALGYAGMAEAYWLKYDALKDSRYLDDALENCVQALAIDDRLASVHITMGMIRAGKGEYERAEAEFTNALKIDPRSADAYRELAHIYEVTGRPDRAEATYKKAIELRKGDWWSVKQLGVFYFNHGSYSKAEKSFREVIRLTPDSAKAYSNLGALYLKWGRDPDALSQLRHSISIEPTANACSNLGSLYYFEEKYQDAAAQFEKAVQLTPGDSTFWGNLADAYRWTPSLAGRAPGAYQRAIELISGEIAINPRDTHLRAKAATWWAALGQRNEAESEIARAIEIAPKDGFVQYRAALVHEQAGQRERALRALKSALDAGYSLLEIERAPPLKRLRTDPRYIHMARPKNGLAATKIHLQL